MQKIKLCVVCGMEIEGNKRTMGNARKTCSIACRDQRYKEKISTWFKSNAQKLKKYHKKYDKDNPRYLRDVKSTLSPWAPMHYDILSD